MREQPPLAYDAQVVVASRGQPAAEKDEAHEGDAGGDQQNQNSQRHRGSCKSSIGRVKSTLTDASRPSRSYRTKKVSLPFENRESIAGRPLSDFAGQADPRRKVATIVLCDDTRVAGQTQAFSIKKCRLGAGG
jgi:hypothetical protein